MPSTTYSLSLARSENGNWSLEPSANLPQHPTHPFPPMAFPADMLPAPAQTYAADILTLAHVPTPPRLIWHMVGYTDYGNGKSPAFRTAWTSTITAIADPQGI